jgi:hypothetical protein
MLAFIYIYIYIFSTLLTTFSIQILKYYFSIFCYCFLKPQRDKRTITKEKDTIEKDKIKCLLKSS